MMRSRRRVETSRAGRDVVDKGHRMTRKVRGPEVARAYHRPRMRTGWIDLVVITAAATAATSCRRCGDATRAAGSSEAGALVIPPDGLAAIPGDPARSANPQIPTIPFAPPVHGSFDAFPPDHPVIGVSRRDLVVAFRDDTTLGDANAILASIDGRVVGAVGATGLLLVRVPDAPSPGRAAAARPRLAADPRIAHVLVDDAILRPNRLPPRNDRPPVWRWHERPYAPGAPQHGNWWLEAARFPQAWNFIDRVKRLADPRPIEVGVIDGGFDPGHEDLGDLELLPGNPAGEEHREHGTGVAAVIAASWSNRLGVDGVYPFGTPGFLIAQPLSGSDIFLVAGAAGQPEYQEPAMSSAGILAGLLGLVARPAMRAVNNSYGIVYDDFNTGPLNALFYPGRCLDPARDAIPAAFIPWWTGPEPLTWRGYLDLWAGLYLEQLEKVDPAHRVVIVATAGNDGVDAWNRCSRTGTPISYTAFDASPLAYLGAEVRGRFLTVMAADHQGALADFSGREGTITAPGVCIRTAEAYDPAPGSTQYRGDGDLCAAADPNLVDDPRYATTDGTSVAAPIVTALAGLVARVNPDLGGDEIARILRDNVDDHGVVDAFAAVVAAGGAGEMVRAVVDIDDGSLDGNRRTTRAAGDVVVDASFEDDEAYRFGGREPARLRGDGSIDMADFRAYRDARLQTSHHPQVDLDGDPSHSKKDLNQDGHVGTKEQEDLYPRADLNGDGSVSWDARTPGALGHPRPPDLAGKTDLEVLASLWPDDPKRTEGVRAADLAGLLESGDLEIHADAAWSAGVTELEITITGKGVSPAIVRRFRATDECDRPGERCIVVSVPWASGSERTLEAKVVAGLAMKLAPRKVFLRPGSDQRIDLGGGQLLYTRYGDVLARRDLVLFDAATQTSTVLVAGHLDNFGGYCISGDGARVLVSMRSGKKIDDFDLYSVGVDGSGLEPVAADPSLAETDPRCPRAGAGDRFFYLSRPAVPREGNLDPKDIVRLDRVVASGAVSWRSTRLVTGLALDTGWWDVSPPGTNWDVSPDGGTIAYATDCAITLLDGNGSTKSRAPGGDVCFGAVRWSRDGERVHTTSFDVVQADGEDVAARSLYVSQGGGDGHLEISCADLSCTLLAGGAEEIAPTPDGGLIVRAYMTFPAFYVALTGGGYTPVVPEISCHLSVSADGTLVAYDGCASYHKVWVSGVDGAGASEVGSGCCPQFAPR